MDNKVKALNLQLAVFAEQSPEDAAQNAQRLQTKIDDLMDQLDAEVQKRNDAQREARQLDRHISQFESQLNEKEKLKEIFIKASIHEMRFWDMAYEEVI